jgi:hypothetical protein
MASDGMLQREPTPPKRLVLSYYQQVTLSERDWALPAAQRQSFAGWIQNQFPGSPEPYFYCGGIRLPRAARYPIRTGVGTVRKYDVHRGIAQHRARLEVETLTFRLSEGLSGYRL